MSPEVLKLATYFCQQLLYDLGPTCVAEAVALNDAESNPGICHSHDRCDANQSMLDAIERAGLLRGVAVNDQAYIDLCGRAWALARLARFNPDLVDTAAKLADTACANHSLVNAGPRSKADPVPQWKAAFPDFDDWPAEVERLVQNSLVADVSSSDDDRPAVRRIADDGSEVRLWIDYKDQTGRSDFFLEHRFGVVRYKNGYDRGEHVIILETNDVAEAISAFMKESA